MSAGPFTVTLSVEQVVQALSDYCDAHRLVPKGTYRTTVVTTIADGKIDHVRLTYEPREMAQP